MAKQIGILTAIGGADRLGAQGDNTWSSAAGRYSVVCGPSVGDPFRLGTACADLVNE